MSELIRPLATRHGAAAALVRILVAVSALCIVSAPARADVFTFRVQSLHKVWVKIEFRSQNRSVVWPGNNVSWDLKDDSVHAISLKCNAEEKICFGAWEHASGSPEWGVGRSGKSGCSQCCWTCSNEAQTPVITMSVVRPLRGPQRPVVSLQSTSPKTPKQSTILDDSQ